MVIRYSFLTCCIFCYLIFKLFQFMNGKALKSRRLKFFPPFFHLISRLKLLNIGQENI